MIYVIAERDSDGSLSPYVKVGFVGGATDREAMSRLKRRVNQMQVGNPRLFTVVATCQGSRETEKHIHHKFDDARVRRPAKCEWIDSRNVEFATWLATISLPVPLTFGKTLPARGVRRRKEKKIPVPASFGKACDRCQQTTHRTKDCRVTLILSNRPSQTNWTWRDRTRSSAPPAPRHKEWEWRGKVRYG